MSAPKPVIARIGGFALACAFTVLILASALWLMGTSPGFLRWSFDRYAPPETTGLTADEVVPVARMIAGYLRGDSETFQYERELPDSTVFPLFHGYEQAHMADCRALYRLDHTVMLAALILLAVSAAVALPAKDRRQTGRGVRAGVSLTVLLLAALGVWGLCDFDGLFVTFHRLAFTNDLWLLNPKTDLLVRLMPLPFFVFCASLLAAALVLSQALLLILSHALIHGKRKRSSTIP